MKLALPFSVLLGLSLFAACGGDDEGDTSEADRVGVGAACVDDEECAEYLEEQSDGTTGGEELICLQQFTGGYCGLEGCTSNEDCPEAAACVAHTDGVNYCFRRCIDKAECNENRPPEAESNCSANITFVDPSTSGKACVPPSSGA
jgi:hypothetical protein